MVQNRIARVRSFSLAASAFTLIELLVVITIIALLAAILFPVFAQAREKARQTTCASNLKQLGIGVQQYMSDNDNVFPTSQYGTSPLKAFRWRESEWQLAIYPYVKNKAVYRCPNDIQEDIDPANPTNAGPQFGVRRSPVSYRYNPHLGCLTIGYPQDQSAVNPLPKSEAAVGDPGRQILLMEGYTPTTAPPAAVTGRFNAGLDMDGKKSLWLEMFVLPTSPGSASSEITGYTKKNPTCFNLPRHAGHTGNNFLFTDGHVKYFNISGGLRGLEKAIPFHYAMYTEEDRRSGFFNNELHWDDSYSLEQEANAPDPWGCQ